MATINIRSILKRKKINGDLVGRYIALNHIAIISGQKRGLLNETETETLVNRLSLNEDVERYFQYVHLTHYIDKANIRIGYYEERIYSTYLKIHMRIVNIIQAEEARLMYRSLPVIKHSYEYVLYKMSVDAYPTSVERLFFFVLANYIYMYQKEIKTPIDYVFDKYSKEKWQDENKLNMLISNIDQFASFSGEMSKDGLKDLRSYFPELYKAIVNDIVSHEELVFIKELEIDDFFNERKPQRWKKIDEEFEIENHDDLSDLEYAKKYGFRPAILARSEIYRFEQDNQDFSNENEAAMAIWIEDVPWMVDRIKYPKRIYEDSLGKEYELDTLFTNGKNEINEFYQELKDNIATYYANREIFIRIGELLEDDRILKITPSEAIDVLDGMNNLIKNVKHSLSEYIDGPWIEKYDELFPCIDYVKFKPSLEKINNMKILFDDISKINGNEFMKMLLPDELNI